MAKICRICERELKEKDTFYALEAIRYQHCSFSVGPMDGGEFHTDLPKSRPTLSTGIHITCERCFRLHYDNVHIRMVGV